MRKSKMMMMATMIVIMRKIFCWLTKNEGEVVKDVNANCVCFLCIIIKGYKNTKACGLRGRVGFIGSWMKEVTSVM